MLTQAHLHVGDRFTAHLNGKALRLHLVGEILDQDNNDLLLRGGWSALAAADPSIQPGSYEVQLRPGTDPQQYATQIRNQSGGALDANATERSDADSSFILLNTVIAGLALVLTAIAVAGVFNTVVLTTREKARDVAILKTVGMAPVQVVAMVIASVALLGLIAGAIGAPLGLELHRQILLFMGQIASGTGIPPAFFDLINHAVLPLLALTGMAVAAVGAWVPAQWAASSGVAEVLQAE
jgi:putative ABC transport system permease protein